MTCCTDQKLVYTDTDVVCSSCGIISDDIIESAPVSQKSKVIACDESRMGSADICPSSILHSKKHRNILESRQNPYEKKLFDCCTDLGINHNCTRRALYLFRAILHTRKIPLGIAAFFVIFQTCRENNVLMKNDTIISSVLGCFSLKRTIRPKRAIFVARSVLLDAKKQIPLCRPDDTDSVHLRKIDSEVLRRCALRLSDMSNGVQTAVNVIECMGVDAP